MVALRQRSRHAFGCHESRCRQLRSPRALTSADLTQVISGGPAHATCCLVGLAHRSRRLAARRELGGKRQRSKWILARASDGSQWYVYPNRDDVVWRHHLHRLRGDCRDDLLLSRPRVQRRRIFTIFERGLHRSPRDHHHRPAAVDRTVVDASAQWPDRPAHLGLCALRGYPRARRLRRGPPDRRGRLPSEQRHLVHPPLQRRNAAADPVGSVW